MKNNKTRTLCEAAIFIAMAEILSFIKLYEFPNGGSVTLAMLPIILFAVRYGCGWGAGAGFVFGTVTYLIGNKFSIEMCIRDRYMPDEFFVMTMTSAAKTTRHSMMLGSI